MAFVGSNRLDAGVRVTVLDGASGAPVFRGPVDQDAGGLGLDGAHVAYWTEACTLVADLTSVSSCGRAARGAVRADSTEVVSRGRVASHLSRVRRLPERTRGRLPRRRPPAHAVRLPAAGDDTHPAWAHAHAADPLEGAQPPDRLTVRVTDPDGRTRTVYDA